jgi:general secretion pathway protein D
MEPMSSSARLAAVLVFALWPCLLSAQESSSRIELDETVLVNVFNANEQFNVGEVLQSWGAVLGQIVVAEPQVAEQKINLLTRQNRMTWGVFKKILLMNGIVIVEDQVGPEQLLIKAYLQRNLANSVAPPFAVIPDTVELPRRSEIVTAIIPIKWGAGREIFSNVRALVSRDRNRTGAIVYVQGPEAILVTDFADSVAFYEKIIKALDVEAPGQSTQMRKLEFAIPSEISQVLQQLFQGEDGFSRPADFRLAVGAQLAQPVFVGHDPTRNLIVRAYSHQFAEIERLVAVLDVKVREETGKFHVYKCENSNAESLAEKLSELFSQRLTGQTGQAGGVTAPTAPGAGGFRGPGAIGAARPTGTSAQSGAPREVATRIVADPRLNALLIQAEEEDYQAILRLLRQLDKKRRRVFIEAMVWEIAANDDLTIATELAALGQPHDGSLRPLAATSFGLSDISLTSTGIGRDVTSRLQQGITAILTKDAFDRVPVILNLLQGTTQSKRITTPFAITNDNDVAVFRVTDRQPFNTTTINNVASQQNVQFVDATSQLTIEPQVNSNDNLTLDLQLVISSFGARPSIDLPPATTSREYSGRVTVPNGQYIVFGGLDSESYTVAESKIPFLGDIPVLGHAFKRWQRSETKTKVYVFIRPVIFFDEEFRDDLDATNFLRKKAHVEAEREEWLAPMAPDPSMPKGRIEDEAFDLFGVGSASPFD